MPALEIYEADGSVLRLTQSLAIIEFLEDNFPGGHSLMPKTAKDRARARQIAEIVNSGIQPLQNIGTQRFLRAVEVSGLTTEDGTIFGARAIANGLAAIEKIISSVAPAASSLFSIGSDTPSLADICLVPQAEKAKEFGVDISLFPCTKAVVDRCKCLSVFISAAPESQVDAIT